LAGYAQDFGPTGVYLSITLFSLMKKTSALLCCIVTFIVPAVLGQQRLVPPLAWESEQKLTRFNLDFPGGTPLQLVAEIQKALGRPLNAIVPPEHVNRPLPALKMTGVNAAELFRALTQAGQRTEQRPLFNNSWTQIKLEYGFRTTEVNSLSDESIWYFYTQGDESPKTTRFYLLTPYLDAGLTVDDITTAITTGWKMRGETAVPVLNFHKETKLLIATGELSPLWMIDDVLKALDPVKTKGTPPAGSKSGEERKAER
jgi:hypothetical protein